NGASPIREGVGSSAGLATVQAVGAARLASNGASSGVASVPAVSGVTAGSVAQAAGTSTANAVGADATQPEILPGAGGVKAARVQLFPIPPKPKPRPKTITGRGAVRFGVATLRGEGRVIRPVEDDTFGLELDLGELNLDLV